MFYTTIIIWVILDLFTKNLALNNLQEQINIWGDFLFFKYVENTGVAFSVQVPFLKYFTVLLIIGIFFYYFSEKKQICSPFLLGKRKELSEGVSFRAGLSYEKIKNLKLLDLSFWLILAWAIWNWYERIFNEKVIDFIWVKYFSVFNLADTFISIWAIIYLYLILYPLALEKE